MIIQLEDCIDVLKHLYPSYTFVFLFDHSNGHDRLRPNGLNLNKINVRFGGKQPKMRDSVLTSMSFGPFHKKDSKLQPGDTQHMQFSKTDDPPFYFSDTDRDTQKYDTLTGQERIKEKTKEMLVRELVASGMKDIRCSKQKLQDYAKQRGISLTYVKKVVVEGYVGKPKGALQILYERGWIDIQKWNQYSVKGRGLEIEEALPVTEILSLKILMQKQEDFVGEVTLLQYHASLLGAILDRSPKCHPELAGEGIEYAWAFAKLFYRRQPMLLKRCKLSF